MDVENFSSITISMLILLPLVAIFAALGNGFVLAVVARFKKLCTFPNILIANLAFADIFNTLINVPVYFLWGVLSVDWMKGKILATISVFPHHLFLFLNLVSMLVMMANVFLAVALDLKYFTWKTKEKAKNIVLVEWLVCLTSAVLSSWYHSHDVDLKDVPVFSYRRSFSIKTRYYKAGIIAAFMVATVVFGLLTFCSIRRRKRQVRKRTLLKKLLASSFETIKQITSDSSIVRVQLFINYL